MTLVVPCTHRDRRWRASLSTAFHLPAPRAQSRAVSAEGIMSLARGDAGLCLALGDQGPEVSSSRSTSLTLADQEAEVAVQLL